jgi:hypothetical protein
LEKPWKYILPVAFGGGFFSTFGFVTVTSVFLRGGGLAAAREAATLETTVVGCLGFALGGANTVTEGLVCSEGVGGAHTSGSELLLCGTKDSGA